MTERRSDWNKRQIDDIDQKVTHILKIMNGNGKIGLSAKVDIMWGYRLLFIGLFSGNVLTLLYFIKQIMN